MKKINTCQRGPCWESYIYVGPEPGTKGSCISRDKITKGHKCYSKLQIQKGGGANKLKIPEKVSDNAKMGLLLRDEGFSGGTQTGWNRGEQLANNSTIDLQSLADMRTWFARHGPDAGNGGTSYPGYCEWVKLGAPTSTKEFSKDEFKGAVSWLIWGGDDAYTWLKSQKVSSLLKKHFPKRKTATSKNNLGC